MRNVFADHPPVRRVTRATVCGLLCAIAALLAVGVSSAPAAVSVSTWWGTPSWSVVSIASKNAFGGTSFERNAGDNRYTYTIKNTKALSEGETLVCRAGEWTNTPTAFGIQWLRNGVAIGGATGSAYTLTAADKGASVQCQVTATNTSATSAVFTLNPVVLPPVPVAAPPGSGSPTVTGTFNVGVSLTCTGGTWTGEPAPTLTYKWFRNGVAIAGAEANKYVLVTADKGTVVQCQVTGANASGTVIRYTASKLVTLATPTWSAVPAVSGTATVGSELTCSNGTWANSPTFTYQWLRGGSEIAGATASKYTVVAADEGKALQCVVTGTNGDGAASAVSANTVVAPAPALLPPTPGNPTVSGTRNLGVTAVCAHGSWGNTPTTYTYQWLRNGAPIAGANSGATPSTQASYSYTIAAADVGKTLQCEVTASNAGGSALGISTVGAAVVNPSPEFSGTTSVAGVAAKAGEKLACTEGTWNESPTEYSYQWLRNGTAISGATGKEYTLAAADQGAGIQCRVTVGNASPNPVVAVSTSLFVTPVPATAPPVLAVAPVLSGTAEEGSELSCQAGVWTGGPVITRQWLRNGVAISGANGETYKLGGAAGNSGEDAGKAIQCQITASNASGASIAFTTRDAIKTEPTNPKVPSVSTEPRIGPSPITVADILPAGMTLGHPPGSYEAALAAPIVGPSGWVCVPATVKCTRTEPMLLGESASFTLAVRASSATPDTAENEVVVSGGGAPSAKLSYSNVITEAMPFGFESFWTSVNEELGTPFTQSVGHPFSATAQFIFNSTTNEEGKMVTAGGDAKNIEVLLPPGFVGSPELAATCPIARFENTGEGCPADSAVGYIWVAVGTAAGVKIVGGKRGIPNFSESGFAAGVIYNLVPPPGKPAAFGFHVSASAFYLTANVRSDGDYGVTITSANTPSNPELMGAEVTFCANGVSDKFGLFGYIKFEFACKAASPNSNSFVQSPAKCTGPAPQTTVRMNSWEHPDQVVSATGYTGRSLVGGAPSASESFVTGCDELSFEPSIEPVPLTREADQGTGVSVFLNVPQQFKVQDGVGSRLACLPGAWEGSPTGFTYQWVVGGVEVPGATSQTYVIAAGDVGKPVQCLVKAANAGGTSATLGTLSERAHEVTSPVTVPPAPATALPAPPAEIAIPSGTASVGSTLTCASGTWAGSPAITYRWLKNGVAIVGATSSSYVVQAGDSKTNIQCEVIGTNAGGAVGAMSPNKSISASPAPPSASTFIFAEVSVASTPGTPEVKDTTVTFPVGLSLSPSAADGLEGCSDAQFAQHSLNAATCPEGSQIGTVKITTPLLTFPLEGQLFLAMPECGDPTPCNANDAADGRMFRLFIQAIDPENGVIVKVAGTTSVDPVTGQVSASFKETPQLPFEVLELKLKNGPRAPLATPQTCGTKTTHSEFVPWSTGGQGGVSGEEQIAGTPNATSDTAFVTDWDGHGGACPATLPFSPTFTAGTTSTQAAASGGGNELSVTMARGAKEQDLGGVSLHMPSGLLGSVSLVKLCEEPQAAAGTCGADSRIGTVTAGAGPGSHPYFVKGSMYLTSSYKGAPFGLSIVVPTKAGPFNLGNVVVRATVNVDPHTAELTVVSDPLPQILDGIPLRLREVNVAVDKEGFIQNPTSCTPETITATISGAAPRERLSEVVKTSNVSSPFDVGGCANVPFKPVFTASTQANLASRKNGASLHVNLSQKHGEANIHSVRVELPIQLPARLTTLQKACTEAQFAQNPAGCPSASLVGSVVAHTPILPVPLAGPAYFVSHGGAKFPELILVLQGDGVTIELDGETFIDPKTNVTSSTFKTVPDAPVDNFELTLPTGPYSALAAPGGLQCDKSLLMPTVITGQNGMQIKQNTTIKTVGCTSAKKLTNAQKLKNALKACKKLKNKTKRTACEKQARKKYAKTAKKAGKQAKKG